MRLAAHRCCFLGLLALAVSGLGGVGAEPPATAPEPRPVLAERLPVGANARLGTARYRLGQVWSQATLTPDGKGVLLSNAAGATLIDLASGELKQRFPVGQAITPARPALVRGNTVIANSENKLCVFDLATGKVLKEWAGEPFDSERKEAMTELSASDDGKVVAFSRDSSEAYPKRGRVWVVTFGVKITSTPFEVPHQGRAWAAVSPDGKTLAVDGGTLWYEDRNAVGPERDVPRVILFDIASGKEISRLKNAWGWWARFSPDGTRLLLGAPGESAQVWDWKNQKLVCELNTKQKPPDYYSGGGERHASSVDGSTIALCRSSGAVQLWDAKTGQLVKTYPPPKLPPGYSMSGSAVEWKKGKLIGLGGWAFGTIGAWDVESGRMLTPVEGYTEPVYSLAFTPDGCSLFAAGYNLPIRRWDLTRPSELKDIKFADPGEDDPVSFGHGSRFFSPDTKWMAVAGGGHQGANTFTVYSTTDGSVRYRSKAAEGILADYVLPNLACSPDGKWIALNGRYCPKNKVVPEICVLDANTGKRREGITIKGSPITLCAFSPKGDRLVVWKSDGFATWDLTKDKLLASGDATWPKGDPNEGGRFNWVPGLTIAPDNRTAIMFVAWRNLGCKLAGWDIETGKNTVECSLPVTWIMAPIAVSYQSGLVAVTGPDRDGEPIIWVASWKNLKDSKILRGHNAEITALAFSPDGKTLASGSNDTSILLWNVSDLAAK